MNHNYNHSYAHSLIAAIHLCIEMRMKKPNHCSDFLCCCCSNVCMRDLAFTHLQHVARCKSVCREREKKAQQSICYKVLL